MQKLKKILSPGSSKDDDIMYQGGDPKSGKLAGEGSHFDHGKSSSAGSTTSPPQVASSAIHNASSQPSSESHTAAETRPEQATRTADPISSTTSHPSAEQKISSAGTPATTEPTPIRSVLTPGAMQQSSARSDVSDSVYSQDAISAVVPPTSSTRGISNTDDSHTARNTALGAGAGAGALGAAGLASSRAGQDDATTRDTNTSASTQPTSTTSEPSSPEQQEIQNATYTYRSYPLASHPTPQRNQSIPYMPGRFPSADSDLPSATGTGINESSTTAPQVPDIPEESSHAGSQAHMAGQEHDSHLGRNTALAGGAAAASAGAYGLGHNRDESTHPGSSASYTPTQTSAVPSSTSAQQSSLPGSSQQTSLAQDNTPTRSEQPSHHYGRDAGLAAGAAAAGAGGYGLSRDRDHERSAEPIGTAHTHDSAQPMATTGVQSQRAAPVSTSHSTPTRDVTSPQTAQNDHHHGRDAALAGGAAGAGAGAYGLAKHHERSNEPTSGSSTTWQNYKPATEGTDARPTAPEPLTQSPPSQSLSSSTPEHKEHHHGRDAGLAGGAAAAGAGAYGLSRHNDTEQRQTGVAPSTQQTQYPTSGAHDSRQTSPTSTGQGYDSRQTVPTSATQGYPSQNTTTTEHERKEHHYGRDAALAGGAAAAGAGAYGLTRNDDADRSQQQPTSSNATQSQVPDRAASNRAGFFAGPQGTAVSSHPHPSTSQSAYSEQRATPVAPHKEGSQDAAAGGAAGNLGRGSFDPPAGQSSAYGQHPTSAQSGQNEHHYGRDAGLAGGAAAAGAGAYGLAHHGRGDESTRAPQSSTLSQPTDRAQSGVAPSGSHSQQPVVSQGAQDGHHYGRDAGLAGGAAAAGAGAYGLAHHGRGDEATGAPQSSAMWQPTDRVQPGVASSGSHGQQPVAFQGAQDGHHYGRDTGLAGGAAAAGAGAYGLAHQGRNDEPSHSNVVSQPTDRAHTGPSYPSQTTPATTSQTHAPTSRATEADKDQDHHYGRNAALAGGAAAAGGAGAYALHNRDRDAQGAHPAQTTTQQHATPASTTTATPITSHSSSAAPTDATRAHDKANPADSTTDKRRASSQDESHKGRNAALAGGAAVAGGVGAHELSKKEQEKLEKEKAKEAEKAEKQHQKELKEQQKHQEKEAVKAEKEHKKELEHQEKEAKKKADKEAAAAATAAEAEKKKHEKEEKKKHEKEEKKHQKEVEKEEKKHEKEDKHDKRKREQEAAAAAAAAEAERKHHEEQNQRAEHERQKALEKEQEKAKHEEDKDDKQKKRRSIFGFLHRDKDDKESRRSSSQSRDEEDNDGKSHKKEAAAVGVVGAGAGAAGYSALHKDRDETTPAGQTSTSPQTAAGIGATGPSTTTAAGTTGTSATTPAGTTGTSANTAAEPAGHAVTRDQAGPTTGNTVPPATTQTSRDTAPVESKDTDHHGRAGAAAAGTAGVAGAGAAYAATRDRNTQPTDPSDRARDTTATTTTTTDPHNKHHATHDKDKHHHDNRSPSADKDDKSKKRRSFLGFLHRDKSKDRTSRTSSSRSRSRGADRASAPGGIATSDHAHDSRHAGSTGQQQATQEQHAGHAGTDGPIGRSSVDRGGNTEGVGRHHSKLHKEPPKKVREELEHKAEEMRRRSYDEEGGDMLGRMDRSADRAPEELIKRGGRGNVMQEIYKFARASLL